jgi:hypothetical protein
MRTLVKRPSINNRLAAARLNTRKAGEPHSQVRVCAGVAGGGIGCIGGVKGQEGGVGAAHGVPAR